MNLDSLNKWLVLVSNIGVLAGIIFLGLEINQNSDALISGSRQGLLEADLNILDNYFDYPEVFRLTRNLDGMDDAEVRQEVLLITMMRTREFAWQQYRRGLVDEETFLSYLAPAINLLSAEAGRRFLQKGGYTGDPEFTAFVKSRLNMTAQ